MENIVLQNERKEQIKIVGERPDVCIRGVSRGTKERYDRLGDCSNHHTSIETLRLACIAKIATVMFLARVIPDFRA